MKDAFSEMLSTSVGYMPVLGEGDRVVGIVTASDAQRLIEEAGSINNIANAFHEVFGSKIPAETTETIKTLRTAAKEAKKAEQAESVEKAE